MEGRAFVDRPSTRKFYCPGCRAVETDGRSARALIIYRRPIWIGFLLLLQSLTFGIGTVRWRYLGLFLALHILSCRHEAQLDFHLRSPPISRPFFFAKLLFTAKKRPLLCPLLLYSISYHSFGLRSSFFFPLTSTMGFASSSFASIDPRLFSPQSGLFTPRWWPYGEK